MTQHDNMPQAVVPFLREKSAYTRLRQHSVVRIVSNLFRALVGSYGVSVSGYLLLRLLIGEAWGMIGFLNSFFQVITLPSLVLLPMSLLMKRRWLALSQIPAALSFLFNYGALFLPQEQTPGDAITVLTYNMHAEVDQLDGMLALIREAGADVVALQEVSATAAERINAELADLYPHRVLHPVYPNGTQGQGFLSIYPVLESEYWRNEQHPAQLGHLRAVIEVEGTRITFYNTHPVHPGMTGRFYDDTTRGMDIDLVLARADAEPNGVVILGDFNMGDQSDDYGRITARYLDSHREVGWGLGLTFPDWRYSDITRAFTAASVPALLPVLRLDYVFVRGVRPLETRVWDSSGGSDHYPLFVRLAYR